MIRALFLGIVVAAGLAGCAHRPPSGPIDFATIPLPAEVERLLGLSLPPASFGGTAAFDQIISGRVEGQEASLRVRVEIQPDKLAIAGLNPFGLPLFTLTQTDAGLEVSGERMLPFDPRFALVDFSLAFWPGEQLAPALAARGLRLETEGDMRRVFGPDGRLLVSITEMPGGPGERQFSIRHTEPAYELRVRSRPAATS